MAQLAFDGNCRQAFEYYEKVLNGKITIMNAQGDTKDIRCLRVPSRPRQSTSPLTEVAWAPRFGQLVDRFGAPWLILALNAR